MMTNSPCFIFQYAFSYGEKVRGLGKVTDARHKNRISKCLLTAYCVLHIITQHGREHEGPSKCTWKHEIKNQDSLSL